MIEQGQALDAPTTPETEVQHLTPEPRQPSQQGGANSPLDRFLGSEEDPLQGRLTGGTAVGGAIAGLSQRRSRRRPRCLGDGGPAGPSFIPHQGRPGCFQR